MKLGAFALIVLVAVCAAAAALGLVLPIEEGTCSEMYASLYGPTRDPKTWFAGDLWDCAEQMQKVHYDARLQPRIDDLERPGTPLASARAAIAEDAMRRRALEATVARENEAALIAQLSPAVCPAIDSVAPTLTVWLAQAKQSTLLYSLETAKTGQPVAWKRSDGKAFCTDDDCAPKLVEVQVLYQTHKSGSPAMVRAWLHCP